MRGSTLTFDIAPSRRLAMAVAALHALAGVAVLSADLAWWCRVPLVVAVLASLVVSMRRPRRVALRCRPDGSLGVRVGDAWFEASLSAGTVVLPWLAMLHYRAEGRTGMATCLVLSDSLGQDDFRRLRVWLRWRGKLA